jgi:hypothetical protein
VVPLSDAAWATLGGNTPIACRVQAWRDGRLLAASVPVASGQLTGDRSLAVPEEVRLTVPTSVDGFRWDPLREDDPLAPYGSRLRVAVGVQLANRKYEWLRRGEFLVTDVVRDGDSVNVTAPSILQLVAEARLVTPLQPKSGDTLKRLARRLVEPGLPVKFDDALVDRAVPVSSLQWDDDRLGALQELAAAWPARLRMHRDGYLLFEPDTDPDPTDYVADSQGAIDRTTAATGRDGGVNCVVARGTAADGTQVQGVAYDTVSASPTRYRGPFSPYPVPQFFDSPLLTTVAQCQAAATTIMRKRRRAVARAITQDMTPAPMLELGDVIRTFDDRLGGPAQLSIETMVLPLTAGDGAMTLGLAVPT